MSSFTRCEPKFPARRCLVDASALVRFYKCEAFELLSRSTRVAVAGQVAKEFKRLSEQRARFDALNAEILPLKLGTRAFDHFSRLRGGRMSTRDLGEDETLALALEAREGGERIPIVIFDDRAGKDARNEGLVVLDFLDVASWLVGCGLATAEEADQLIKRAGAVDGYRPPAGYPGAIESVRISRQNHLVASFSA